MAFLYTCPWVNSTCSCDSFFIQIMCVCVCLFLSFHLWFSSSRCSVRQFSKTDYTSQGSSSSEIVRCECVPTPPLRLRPHHSVCDPTTPTRHMAAQRRAGARPGNAKTRPFWKRLPGSACREAVPAVGSSGWSSAGKRRRQSWLFRMWAYQHGGGQRRAPPRFPAAADP